MDNNEAKNEEKNVIEYRQCHINNVFRSEEQIFFSQTNSEGLFSLHELLRVTSDLAVEDYNQRGMSREYLKEKGFAILVSRLAFRFHKMPVENQKVEVVTWEEKPEPLQLARNYRIYEKGGKELLVSGKSYWLVCDLKSRRLIPTSRFNLREPSTEVSDMDCLKPGKIGESENMELWDSRKIRYSDLDTNGHTTNSRYGAFIEDAIPAEYRKRVPVDFRINYSKEAMLDSQLDIYGKIEEDGKKLRIVGKTTEGCSFEAELYY
ncbi:acyl-[acyl-carrier-protein] thioesterase [Treponema sp.]|uniref:acyl-[acyl-carrier-protein] thioesterase n=1 Tax=Treponema sp. TaxID=166 RepID=UPI00388ECA55